MEKYASSYSTWHLLFKYDKLVYKLSTFWLHSTWHLLFKYLRQSSLQQMQYILVATIENPLYVKSFKTSN